MYLRILNGCAESHFSFNNMCSSQFLVAVEFGYPNNIVRRVLKRQKFKDAGSLIEYLEDNEEQLQAEDDDDEEGETVMSSGRATPTVEGEKPKLTLFIPPRKKELGLREETELMYKQSICLLCQKSNRAYVLLPCCHLAVCAACLPKTTFCPKLNCKTRVMEAVFTYGISR